MLKPPNRVLPYLGYDDDLLEARITSRCPGCSPPPASNGDGPPDCTSPFNVPIVENSAIITSGTNNNYTLIADGLFWLETNYSSGNGYQNLTAYDICTGLLVKDVNITTLTGRYLSGKGLVADANGVLWSPLSRADYSASPPETLWLNFDPSTDTAAEPADMVEGGLYRVDDSRVLSDVAHNSVWIEADFGGNACIVRRNITTDAQDVGIPCTVGDWPELDTTNYRMWVIPINAALPGAAIKVYDAADGTLLETISLTSTESPWYAYYNTTRDEMLVNCYHTAGTKVFVYDGATYALIDTKNLSTYGANLTGQVIGYVPTSEEYVMLLNNTVSGVVELAFADATTWTFTGSYLLTDLAEDAGANLAVSVLASATNSIFLVLCHSDYTQNRLVKRVRTAPAVAPPAPTSPADVTAILADMGSNELALYNATISTGWAVGAHIDMGSAPRGDATPNWWIPANINYKTSDPWLAVAPWFVLYPGVGNAATNTRVKVYDLVIYALDRISNTWTAISTGDGNPSWSGKYGFNLATPKGAANTRTELDGTTSYKLSAEQYPIRGGFPKIDLSAYANVANISAIFVSAKTQLIVDDPLLTDDRASAKILLNVGADYYPTLATTVANFTPMTYTPAVGGSRFGLASSTIRTHYFATVNPPGTELSGTPFLLGGGSSTISAAALAANPPPF